MHLINADSIVPSPIGVIGTGGRGQYLMKTLNQIAPGEIEFVAVCDVYDVRRAQAAAEAQAARRARQTAAAGLFTARG